MDTSQYKDLFVSETLEHLQLMNQMTVALEQDPESGESLEQIFRSAHTIKGMAATMGYSNISQLAHALEDLLDRVQEGEQAVTTPLVDLVFKGVDGLSTLLDDVAADRPGETDVQALIAQLQGFSSTEEAADRPRSPEEPETLDPPHTTTAVHVALADDCQMPSIRAHMVLEQLRDLGEVVATDPSQEALTEENFEGFCVYLNTDTPSDRVKATVEGISEVASAEVSTAQDDEPEQAEPIPSGPESEPAQKEREAGLNRSMTTPATKMIRVNVEHLDQLLNLVSELVISRGQLADAIEALTRKGANGDEESFRSLSEAMDRHDRTLSHLHESVLQVRMVPVSHIFDRFPRMMRDLLRDLGKEAQFQVSGREVEMDRAALEALGDPLVHLLRNAADHGLEEPEERERAGKAREGLIQLSARRQRGQAIIEVKDDGRGMDVEQILKTAIERDIVPKERSHELSHDQVLMLICEPGFSLSERVTDVSGRGVGMNAVKLQVEALQGTLEIETEPGHGTTFRLLLPLSLALTQAMTIRVGQETFAVPLHFIEQTIKADPERVQKLHRWEMLRLDDQVLPIFELGELLGMPNDSQVNSCEALVVRRGSQRLGLLVDDLLGKQEIVVKPLPKSLAGLSGLSGTTILGAGRVVMILDIPNLIQDLV